MVRHEGKGVFLCVWKTSAMNLSMIVNAAIWLKAPCAIIRLRPVFCWNMWSSLLYDDKTKATNFLRLIAFELMNYLVGSWNNFFGWCDFLVTVKNNFLDSQLFDSRYESFHRQRKLKQRTCWRSCWHPAWRQMRFSQSWNNLFNPQTVWVWLQNLIHAVL